MKKIQTFLFLILVLYLSTSCGPQISKEEKNSNSALLASKHQDSMKILSIPHKPIEVIYHRTFGSKFGKDDGQMYMCFIQDTNWIQIYRESLKLIKGDPVSAAVYCYIDKSKIWNIEKCKNYFEAIPPEEGVGYVTELWMFKNDPDLAYSNGIRFTKFPKNIEHN